MTIFLSAKGNVQKLVPMSTSVRKNSTAPKDVWEPIPASTRVFRATDTAKETVKESAST